MGFEAGVYTIRESRRQVELPIVITDPPSGGAPWPFTLLLNTHGNSAGIQYTSGKNHFHEMNGDVGMAGWK